jgi:hypothetical protein
MLLDWRHSVCELGENRCVRNVVTRTASCRNTPDTDLALKSCYISRFFFKNSRQTDLRQLQEREFESKSKGLLKRRAAADLSLTESDWCREEERQT